MSKEVGSKTRSSKKFRSFHNLPVSLFSKNTARYKMQQNARAQHIDAAWGRGNLSPYF